MKRRLAFTTARNRRFRGFPPRILPVTAPDVNSGNEHLADVPAMGRFAGPAHACAHHLPVRVYFEDTDHSGLVYHANYLRYMERARSDMLRLAGVDQKAAFDAGEGVYAVADLSIRYLRPARYDDALVVISRVAAIRAASVIMRQTIVRRPIVGQDERLGDERLTEATVHAAFLSLDGRPKRQPKRWIDLFTPLLETQN